MTASTSSGEYMRRTVLTMLLVIFSGSATAEWIAFGSDEGRTGYIDKSSIQTNNKLVTMTYLLDYRKPQKLAAKGYLSFKSEAEFDCEGEEYRAISTSFHSGNMGEGKIISSKGRQESQPVEPGTVAGNLFKLACGIEDY
jgi:hypothetical protein